MSSISLPLHGSNRPQHYDKRVLHLVVASPMDCRHMTEGSYIYVVSLVMLCVFRSLHMIPKVILKNPYHSSDFFIIPFFPFCFRSRE